MTPRRDYGTGSTYQRKSDWRWVATVEHGYTVTGARRRIAVTTAGCPGGCPKRCPHRADIRRKLRDRRLALEKQGPTDVSSRDTVKKWADVWLTVQERTLRPSAYVASRSAVTKWIVPTIGHKRFDTLTPADVRAVATAQRKAGRSQGTQIRTHSVLMSLLRGAQLEGYPISERVLATKGPEKGVSDREPLSVAHAITMLEHTALIPHGSRWVAAFLEGMRQGECLGLTWDAVDFEHGEIELSWQLQPMNYRIKRDRSSGFRVPDGYEAKQLAGRLHLVRPKTKAGVRVIPMVPWMQNSLEAWREVAPSSPHNLVWPMLDGSPTPAKLDDQEFHALQQTAGIHHPSGRFYTPHEARHTTATLLIEAGVDRAVIAAILGQTKLVEAYVNVRRSPIVREGLQKVADRLAIG